MNKQIYWTEFNVTHSLDLKVQEGNTLRQELIDNAWDKFWFVNKHEAKKHLNKAWWGEVSFRRAGAVYHGLAVWYVELFVEEE